MPFKNKLLPLLLFALALFVAFDLRAADLSTIPPGLHRDEGENLQRSWRLLQGYGFLPEFGNVPEPFDAIARAGFLAFTGVTPFNARLFHVLLNVLGVAATMAAGRVLWWRHPYRDVIALAGGLTLAALPPPVMIGRGIYAANWIPFTTMMSVMALVWAWRTNKTPYFVIASIFAALAVTFYLAGIVFPMALLLVLILLAASRRWRWPRRRHLALLVASGGVTLLPWFSMFLWIPDWLAGRVNQLADGGATPLQNPALLLPNLRRALEPIFIADTVSFPVYAPYTTAFLNPALIVLFAVGVLFSLQRWRQVTPPVPLIVAAVMIAPNVLSNAPETAIRMSGIFAPVGLIVGYGAGEILRLSRGHVRQIIILVLAAVFIYTPINTRYHVWYHYTKEPRLLDDPTSAFTWPFLYREGYGDFLRQVTESKEPVYVPIEQVNSDLAAALLRPSAFPTVRPYGDEPLPAGILWQPTHSLTYGFPEVDQIPQQYALALPDSGEIVILPPLSPERAKTLEEQAQTEGDDLYSSQGWLIGKQLALTAQTNLFASTPYHSDEPLATFDNRLELVGIEAPRELVPGGWLPVTLHWRLNERAGADYFVRVQVWDYTNTSRGAGKDSAGFIFRHLYPTVMWTPGEIVSETRWVQVYGDAPPGGYRFGVSVYTYPGPKAVSVAGGPDAEIYESWALVGSAAVAPEQFTTNNTPPMPVNAQLGESMHLIGAAFEPPLNALQTGDTLKLRLYWQVEQPVSAGYTIFLHLKNVNGDLIAQQDVLPHDGQYPTWAWQPGETIDTTHALAVPADQPPPYTLAVGMYSWPSLERLPTMQDGQAQTDNVVTFKTEEE
ncbi:MAG: hypothetical protein HZC41_25355 [Chloroflexi bacterium]|nr:hypothetical protein [Chloroflexota bacterium]